MSLMHITPVILLGIKCYYTGTSLRNNVMPSLFMFSVF